MEYAPDFTAVLTLSADAEASASGVAIATIPFDASAGVVGAALEQLEGEPQGLGFV